MKCRPTLRLAGRIIDGSNEQEKAIHYFPGDDLFSPFERRRGLPLGNQTSQFLANVYLNPLDQYVNRELRPACYIRYVDDFLLFGDSKAKLAEMRCAVEDFLEGLRLLVHERKSRVYRCADGVAFLGWRLFPERSRLVRDNVVRFRRRLRHLERAFREGVATRSRFEREFTRGLGTRPPGIPGVCASSCLHSSRWRMGVLSDVIRGGSWNNNARRLRVSNRNRNDAEERNDNIGFRCVRDEERRYVLSS